MGSSSNGRYDGPHDRIRRLRYDDVPALMEKGRRRAPRAAGAGAAIVPTPWPDRDDSGRRFVILSVLGALIVSGMLYLVFREWRSRYRIRADYGAKQVAPAIDAFADFVPRGVEEGRWRDAVARTHAMLVTITASNLLDLAELRDLRAELRRAAARVEDDHETAIAELAAVWDDMAERGEFLMRDTRKLDRDRHPRPAILPTYGDDRVAPALDPMDELTHEGVEPARWRDAVDRTRALLREVTRSRFMSTVRMMALRQELDRAVAAAREKPGSAVRELAAIWEMLARSARTALPDKTDAVGRLARPEILAPR